MTTIGRPAVEKTALNTLAAIDSSERCWVPPSACRRVLFHGKDQRYYGTLEIVICVPSGAIIRLAMGDYGG